MKNNYEPIVLTDDSTIDDYIHNEKCERHEIGDLLQIPRAKFIKAATAKFEQAQERIKSEKLNATNDAEDWETKLAKLDALAPEPKELTEASCAANDDVPDWSNFQQEPPEYIDNELPDYVAKVFAVQLLDKAIPNPRFPHVDEKQKPKPTIQNLEYLLDAYSITLEYDEILKRRSIIFAGHGTKGHDMEDESAMMVIKSLCGLNGLSPTLIEMLPAIFQKYTINPIKNWIQSKAWDGIDRKQQLFETITVEAGSENYRNQALNVWLTQCAAAADNGEIGHSINPRAIRKFEIVLILQGKQGGRKTSWIGALLPDSLRDYVKDGMHLDPTDKDTTKKCISTWLCELGEIDATFRRADIARLKAFMSNQVDEMRLPYDRTTMTFKRRTSFCASVNGEQFLTDATGSRRFVTIPILSCNDSHGLDMQQIFAQYWHEYTNGAIWWTTNEFDEEVKARNEKHNEVSAIAEMVAEFFNVNDADMAGAVHLSPTRILLDSGIREPKRQQVKELTEFLQSKGFRYKARDGYRGFTIAQLIR